MQESEESLLTLLYLEKVKEWTKKNKILITLIFTGLILALLLLYKTTSKPQKNALLAEKAYQNFLMSKDESSMRKLIALALKDRSVALIYDLPISLYFLEHHQLEEAKPFMERSLSELGHLSPFHETYAKGTSAILSSDWRSALQSALLLKGQFTALEDAKKKYPSLYNANLLRIAILNKKIQNQSAELAAWQELQGSPGHAEWIESLHENGIAMKDFIEDRLEELKSEVKRQK